MHYFIIRSFAVALLSLSVLYCRNPGLEEIEKVYYSEEGVLTDKEFFDYVESIELIALTTPQDIVLGEDCELAVEEDAFYIIDKSQARAIRFTTGGKFLNFIGDHGRGKGEYPFLTGFQPSADTLKIYSEPDSTVYNYSKEGIFLGLSALKKHFNFVHFFPEGYLGYAGGGIGTPYRIYRIMFSGAVREYLPSESKQPLWEVITPFTEYKTGIVIRETFCDTVYRCIPPRREIEPHRVFDWGKFSVPGGYFLKEGNELLHYMMHHKFMTLSRYLENETLCLAEALLTDFEKGFYRYGILFKEKNEWKWFDLGEIHKNPFVNSFRAAKKKKLYCLLYPGRWDALPAEAVVKITNPGVLNRVKTDDNPLIALLSFK